MVIVLFEDSDLSLERLGKMLDLLVLPTGDIIDLKAVVQHIQDTSA